MPTPSWKVIAFPPELLVFLPPGLLLQSRSLDGFNQILGISCHIPIKCPLCKAAKKIDNYFQEGSLDLQVFNCSTFCFWWFIHILSIYIYIHNMYIYVYIHIDIYYHM